MQIPRYNVPVIILTFVVTLGILLGGRWVYLAYGVEGPLQKKLAQVPTVAETHIVAKGTETVVQIELGPVDSLQAAYRELSQLLPQNGSYALTIVDRRDDYLTRLWRENQLVLEEAAVLGNLTEMQALLAENLSKASLDSWLLEADRENLYLQLHAGDHYLYEIIPRQHFVANEQATGTSIN